LEIDSNYWSGKRVLLTGHTGFKGSWMVFFLENLGAKVYGLSLPVDTKKRSLYIDANVNSKMAGEYFYDVRDNELLTHIFDEVKPQYVYHFAAQALVQESLKNPIETITVNVMGTLNVLSAALCGISVEGVTIVTTDKVYENLGHNIKFKETDKLGGIDPYSASKSASEIIVRAMAKTSNPKGIPVTTARGGNVIGGGDWGESRLVPDMVRSVMKNESLKLRNPNSLRPWQHVLDCLYGYLLIGQVQMSKIKTFPLSVNFGPPNSMQVIDLVKLFESQFHHKISIEYTKYENFESDLLQLDSQLAGIILGWRPKYDIHNSIESAATWYARFINGESAANLISEDLLNYKNMS